MFRVGVSLVGASVRKFSGYPEPEPTSLSGVGHDGVPKVHHMHYWAAAGVSGLEHQLLTSSVEQFNDHGDGGSVTEP